MLPERIGRYEVLGQLATGGMAEILLARLSGPGDFERAVVIKRMLRQYAQLRSFMTMFLDEARIVAKIRHPNVVQVQELGEDGGEIFLVLEYVAGENLASVLKRAVAAGESIQPALAAHVVAEACAGLHAAHELVSEDGTHQRLVHRDVSPQNLFVAYDGHVKLLDFGVALTEERMTRTAAGDVKGKFEYMSPEQARGEALDRRSDIFALGIVLYELASGRRLFKRTSHAKTLDAICRDPIIPPSRLVPGVPRELDAVCMRALAKRPEDRYATAAEMRRDLQEIARALPSPTEALAERMKAWFPDRIAEKEEMLRKVRQGDPLTRVPPGEVDETVVIPGVPELTARSDPPPAQRRLAAPAALAAGGGVAVLLAVALAVVLSRRARATDVEPPPTTVIELPPEQVIVRVESRPSGARVLADGEERGETPIDLRLPRGAEPVKLELRRAGFAATSQVVVPDADQKLLLALQPAHRPRARPPSAVKATPTPTPSAPPAASSAAGFRRFD